MTFRPTVALLGALLVLAACGPSATQTKTSGKKTTASTAPHATTAGGASVQGVVYAPKGAKGGYRLMLQSDALVPKAVMSLVDLGAAQTTTPEGTSDASGRYEIDGLPSDAVVCIRAGVKLADGTVVSLETLAKTSSNLAADIDIASTMVALTLVQHARGGGIPSFSSITFTKAVLALETELLGKPYPDPTQPDALVAQTETLARKLRDLNAAVGGPLDDGSATTAASPDGAATATPTASPTTDTAATGTASPDGSGTTAAVPTAGPSETFAGSLSGAGESPAVDTAASGAVTATLAADRSHLTLNGNASGLTVKDARLQEGVGTDAKPLHAVAVSGGSLSLAWALNDATQPLTVEAIAALEAGKLYVNLTSAAHPDGEVIAQLQKQ